MHHLKLHSWIVGALVVAGCTGAAGVRTTTYDDPYYKPGPVYAEPLYSDAEISQNVYSALATIPGLDVNDVEVHVQDGVVHLSGHVHSHQSRAELEQLILSIDGVQHVDSADLVVAVPAEEPYRRHYGPGY